MIISFYDQETEDLFNGVASKKARRRLPQQLWEAAQRRLDYLNAAASLEDLRAPKSNRLHPLDDDRAGQHSISINMQYRICFVWTPAGPERVEVTDYH